MNILYRQGMSENSLALQEAIKTRWGQAKDEKVQRYVGKFWGRPNEFGGVRAANVAQQGDYDVVAADAVDLARQMGA
jgi:hypothetical protein